MGFGAISERLPSTLTSLFFLPFLHDASPLFEPDTLTSLLEATRNSLWVLPRQGRFSEPWDSNNPMLLAPCLRSIWTGPGLVWSGHEWGLGRLALLSGPFPLMRAAAPLWDPPPVHHQQAEYATWDDPLFPHPSSPSLT
ncbi:hypothetical protein LX36DRAFT_120462 [Colletotrichum falcatum]|nr:hypothetical protein LX36DRAFT_120462 [Colletotrichum falcatum]